MRTAATIAALLFLLLLASFASAQTPTPTETVSTTQASNIHSSSSLTGTVTVSQTIYHSIIYNVFLQNTGNVDLSSFTVKITNTMPVGVFFSTDYSGSEDDPECETEQDLCSSVFVESLHAGESITRTIEAYKHSPLTCPYDENGSMSSLMQELKNVDKVVENSIQRSPESYVRYVRWTSIRPMNAMAVFEEGTILDLQVPEPLTYHNEQCFFEFEEPPMPTPIPTPTRKPSTVLLPWLAKE